MLAIEFKLDRDWLRDEERKVKGSGKSVFPDYYDADKVLKEKGYDVFESKENCFGIPISLIVVGDDKWDIEGDVHMATDSFRYSPARIYEKVKDNNLDD